MVPFQSEHGPLQPDYRFETYSISAGVKTCRVPPAELELYVT